MTVIRFETGHAYQFVDQGLNRRNARNEARNRGDFPRTGYLAVINDEAENNFVASHNDGRKWLGGWERENGLRNGRSRWYWEFNGLNNEHDGPLFRRNSTNIMYTNWANGEPNDWDPFWGDNNRPERGLVMYGDGRWRDNYYRDRRGYIIEYGRPGAEVNINALSNGQTDAYTATFSFTLDQAVPNSIRNETGIAGINPGLSSPTLSNLGVPTQEDLVVSNTNSLRSKRIRFSGGDTSASLSISTAGGATYTSDTTQPFHAVSLNIENLSSDAEIPFSTSNIANRSRLVYLADPRPQLSTGQGAKQTITQFAGRKESEAVYFDTDGIQESSTKGLRSMAGLDSFQGLSSEWKTFVRIPSDGIYQFNATAGNLITDIVLSGTKNDDGTTNNNSRAIGTKNQHIFDLKQGDVVKIKLDYVTGGVPNIALKWKKIESDHSVLNDQEILNKLKAVSSSVVPGADLFLSERAARNPVIHEDDSVGTPIEIYSTQRVNNDVLIQSTTSHNEKRQAHTTFATRQFSNNTINGDDFRLQTTAQSGANTIGPSSVTPSVGIPSNNSDTRRTSKFKQKNGLWTDSSLYIYPLQDGFAEGTEKIEYTIINENDQGQYRVDNASGTFNYKLADSGTLELALTDVIHTVEGQGNTPGCFIVQPQSQTNNTLDDNSNNTPLRFQYSTDGSNASSARLNRDYLAPLMIETLGEGSSGPAPIVDASNQNQNTCIFITPLKESIDDDTAFKTVDVKIEQNVITDDSGFKFRWFNIKDGKDRAQMKIYNDKQNGKQLLLLNPLTGLLQNHQSVNALIDETTGKARVDFVLMLAKKPNRNKTVSVQLSLDGKTKSLQFTGQTWDQMQPVVFKNVSPDRIRNLNITTTTSNTSTTHQESRALMRPTDDDPLGTKANDASNDDSSDDQDTSSQLDSSNNGRPTASSVINNGFDGLSVNVDVIPVYQSPAVVVTQSRSGDRHLDVVRGSVDDSGNNSVSFDLRLGHKPKKDVELQLFKSVPDTDAGADLNNTTPIQTISIKKQDWNKNKSIKLQNIAAGQLNDFYIQFKGETEKQTLFVAPLDYQEYVDVNLFEGGSIKKELPRLKVIAQSGEPGTNTRAGYTFTLNQLVDKDIDIPINLTSTDLNEIGDVPSSVTIFANTSSTFLPIELESGNQIRGDRNFRLEVIRSSNSDFSIRNSKRISKLRVTENLTPEIILAIDKDFVLGSDILGLDDRKIYNDDIPIEELLVGEGSSSELEIRLNTKPKADVEINLDYSMSDNDGRLIFEREKVIITPDNFNQWKKIKITGKEDGLYRNDRDVRTTLTAVSDDQKYDGLTRDINIKHINVDPKIEEDVNDEYIVNQSRNDDTALAFIVGGKSTVLEGGSPQQYDVRLTKEAHDDVIVRVDVFADNNSTIQQDDFTFISQSQLNGFTRVVTSRNGDTQEDVVESFSEIFKSVDNNSDVAINGYIQIPETGSYSFKIEDFGTNFDLRIGAKGIGLQGVNSSRNSSLSKYSDPVFLPAGLLPISFKSGDHPSADQPSPKLSLRQQDGQAFRPIAPEEILQRPFNHVVVEKGKKSASFSLAPREDDQTVQPKQRLSLFASVSDVNIESIFFTVEYIKDEIFEISVEGERNQDISRLFNPEDIITLYDNNRQPVYDFKFLDAVNVVGNSPVRTSGELLRVDRDDQSSITNSELSRLSQLIGQENSTEIQTEDREVNLILDTLTPDQANNRQKNRLKRNNDELIFRTELTLDRTNIRRGVELAKGTQLDYQLDDGQAFKLELVDDIRIRSGQTRTVLTKLVQGPDDIDIEVIQCANDLTSKYQPISNNRIIIKDNEKAQVNYVNNTKNSRSFKPVVAEDKQENLKGIKNQAAVNVYEGTSVQGFDITLDTKPSENVYLSFETDNTDVTINSRLDTDIDEYTTLTFTPENWDQAQFLTISALDDNIVNGDRYARVYSRIVSDDPVYDERGKNGSTPRNVEYQLYKIIDDDTAEVDIEFTQVTLGKYANEFIDVSLKAQPENDVKITFGGNDLIYLNDKPVGIDHTFTFTKENYDTPQVLEIKAFNNDVHDGNVSRLIDVSTQSVDADFDGLSVPSIETHYIDDDDPIASIRPVLDATEHQESGVFEIVFNTSLPNQPGDPDIVVNYEVISVELDSGIRGLLDPNLSTSTTDLANLIAQSPTTSTHQLKIPRGGSKASGFVVPIDNVVAQAKDNLIVIKLLDGEGYELDNNNNSATIKFLDNDEAGVVLMTSGIPRVSENGGKSEFLLALATQPTSDVQVDLREVPLNDRYQLGDGQNQGLPTVTFTPSNWNTPRVFRFSAQNDKIIEDNLLPKVRGIDEFAVIDGLGQARSSIDNREILDSELAFTGIHPAKFGFNFVSKDPNYSSKDQAGNAGHFVNLQQDVEVVDFVLPDTTAQTFQSSFYTLQESLNNLSFPIYGSLNGRVNNPMQQFGERLLQAISDEFILTPLRVENIIRDEISALINSGMGDGPIAALRNVDIPITVVQDGDDIRIDLNFGDNYELLSVPLAADFGIPGFNLQSRGSVDANFDYSSNLSVVFPSDAGPYIDTTPEKTGVDATLTTKLSQETEDTEAFRFTGGLGFMQMDAVNQPTVNDNVVINGDQVDGTKLAASFGLDLQHPDGMGADGSLSLNEMVNGNQSITDAFQYQFSGDAAMSLGVTTSVNGSSAIPSLKFDLSSVFNIFNYNNTDSSLDTSDEEEDKEADIYFDNIRLDLGTFVTNMTRPIVNQIDQILEPIYPVNDALNGDTYIFERMGLTSEFDRNDDNQVSPIEIAIVFAEFIKETATDRRTRNRAEALTNGLTNTETFLNTMNSVIGLVRDLRSVSESENFYVDFGDYALSDFRADDDDVVIPDPETNGISNLNSDTKEQANNGGSPESQDDNGSSDASNQDSGSSTFSRVMSRLNDLGFGIPLLDDPFTVVNLLLDRPVDLFNWTMPDMGMEAGIQRDFPIWGPIRGVIQGDLTADAAFGFGYDTYGLSEWANASFDPNQAHRAFDGFYVSDRDSEDNDVDEFALTAAMGIGAQLNAVVASATVTGGLQAGAALDLLDVGEVSGTDDGKIRTFEIQERIHNPLELFEFTGRLDAFLRFLVEVIGATVVDSQLATIPLFEFSIGGGSGFSAEALNGKAVSSDNAYTYIDYNSNYAYDEGEKRFDSDYVSYADSDDYRYFDTNQDGSLNDKNLLITIGNQFSGQSQSFPFLLRVNPGDHPNFVLTPFSTFAEFYPDINNVFGIDENSNYQVRNYVDKLSKNPSSEQDLVLAATNKFLHQLGGEMIALIDSNIPGFFADDFDRQKIEVIQFLAQSLESFSSFVDGAFGPSDFRNALKAISSRDLEKISAINGVELSDVSRVISKVAEFASSEYKNVLSFLEKSSNVDSLKQLESHYSKHFDDAKLIPDNVPNGKSTSDSKAEALNDFGVTEELVAAFADHVKDSQDNDSSKSNRKSEGFQQSDVAQSRDSKLSRPSGESVDVDLFNSRATTTATASFPKSISLNATGPRRSESITEAKQFLTESSSIDHRGFRSTIRRFFNSINPDSDVYTQSLYFSGSKDGNASIDLSLSGDESRQSVTALLINGGLIDRRLPRFSTDHVDLLLVEGSGRYVGSDRANTISGDGDDQRFVAGMGNDIVAAGGGADRVRSGQGDDIIRGNSGSDSLNGGRGSDFIRGDRAHDRIHGGRQNDQLMGNRGADRLIGNSGNDRLSGGRHDDTLLGGRGSDRLFGGPNNDVLYGGRRHDRLSGGRGSDVFALSLGRDVITDFNLSEGDKIRLDPERFNESLQLEQICDDLLLRTDDGVNTTILNMNLNVFDKFYPVYQSIDSV